MPGVRTHDAVTILLTPAVAAGAYFLFADLPATAAVSVAFLFGGFMFGPDLDTTSKQYSRWGPLRWFWLPYRSFFRHRSRWSHGLLFGTLFRVIYFMGIVTLAMFAAAYAAGVYQDPMANMNDAAGHWRAFGAFTRLHLGEWIFEAFFAGAWIGAASHTFTDMAVSYVKTGRVTEFL